jgi:hypothetical protein
MATVGLQLEPDGVLHVVRGEPIAMTSQIVSRWALVQLKVDARSGRGCERRLVAAASAFLLDRRRGEEDTAEDQVRQEQSPYQVGELAS